MADNKYLWHVAVRRVSRPIYLVAQNMASAQAAAASHPQVDPSDVRQIRRIDLWDEPNNMTVVDWPEPPPQPDPNEPPR